MGRRIQTALTALLAAVMVFSMAGAALAKENTGNVFFNGDEYLQEGATTQRDLVWAGDQVQFDKLNVGQDALLAGQSIEFTDSKVGGSVRAASQRLSLSGVEVGNNISAAAQQIIYGEKTKAAGSYLAADEIFFEGASKGGAFFARTVNITGKIDGDLRIFAQNVVFGAGAQVTGTAYVVAGSEPTVDPKADIADLQFTQSQVNEQAAQSVGEAAAATAIVAKVLGVVGTLVLALILLLLAPGLGVRVAESYRKRTGATLATGVLSFFLLPILAVLFAVLVVTLPVSGLLLLFMLAGPLFAPAVAGIGVGALLFRKMNRFGSGLLGTVIVVVLTSLPVVGWIMTAVCIMFATGYLLQALRQTRTQSNASNGPAAPQMPQGDTWPNPTGTVPPTGF